MSNWTGKGRLRAVLDTRAEISLIRKGILGGSVREGLNLSEPEFYI